MSSAYPPSGGMQSMPCQRCHAPLLPNEPTCRNCGYYNAPMQGNNVAVQGPPSVNGLRSEGTQQPFYGQNQSQSGPPSWGQFPVSSPTPSPQGQNIFNNPPSTPFLQGQNTFNNPPSSPQQPEGRNFLNAPSAFPTAPPSVQPRRPSGLLSTGQGGSQLPEPGGPVSQAPYGAPSTGPVAPYGIPPVAPQRPPGLLSRGLVGAPQAGPVSPAPYGAPSTGPVSQAPYGMSISPVPYGAPSTGPVSQASYGMPPTGFQQFGAPAVPEQQFPATALFDTSRTQNAGPQSFAPEMAASSSSPVFPSSDQPVVRETLPKRGMKPWMIVLTVLLVIVVVGGALVGYIAINKQNHAVVTPTTSTANTTKGTVLFTDTFKNNANGWGLEADPGVFSCSLAGGFLVLEDDSNELLWQPLPKDKTFSDFTLSADAMLSKGDQTNGYGFYIRGALGRNSEMATYYRFEFYGDGTYAVFKGTTNANGNSTIAKLVNYTLSSAIHKQGIINHITITAKGSSISLLMNGQLLKTITDTSYISGSIAPFVSNMQNAKPGAQAKFANLTISAA